MLVSVKHVIVLVVVGFECECCGASVDGCVYIYVAGDVVFVVVVVVVVVVAVAVIVIDVVYADVYAVVVLGVINFVVYVDVVDYVCYDILRDIGNGVDGGVAADIRDMRAFFLLFFG